MTLEEKLSALAAIAEDAVRESAQMYDNFAETAEADGDAVKAEYWRAAAAERWDRLRALTAERECMPADAKLPAWAVGILQR